MLTLLASWEQHKMHKGVQEHQEDIIIHGGAFLVEMFKLLWQMPRWTGDQKYISVEHRASFLAAIA